MIVFMPLVVVSIDQFCRDLIVSQNVTIPYIKGTSDTISTNLIAFGHPGSSQTYHYFRTSKDKDNNVKERDQPCDCFHRFPFQFPLFHVCMANS